MGFFTNVFNAGKTYIATVIGVTATLLAGKPGSAAGIVDDYLDPGPGADPGSGVDPGMIDWGPLQDAIASMESTLILIVAVVGVLAFLLLFRR